MINKEYDDDTVLDFGVHKGSKLSEVPDEYLWRLYNNAKHKLDKSLLTYIDDNLDAIKANMKRKA